MLIENSPLEADCSFQKNSEIFLLHWNWRPVCPNVTKVLFLLNFLIFQLDFLENNIFEFFYQGMNWRWHLFECSLDRTNSGCFPLFGILMSWTCKKVPLMFWVCQISNRLISKALGLNFFNKFFIYMFLVKFSLCVFMIRSFPDQLFIRLLDRKYRSATAPIVASYTFCHEAQNRLQNRWLIVSDLSMKGSRLGCPQTAGSALTIGLQFYISLDTPEYFHTF